MSTFIRFRDAFKAYTPIWLQDRLVDGLVKGYKYLWTPISSLDVITQFAVEGIIAAWPGVGTPTALAEIGRTRGIIRGQGETDANYIVRLLDWWERYRKLGMQQRIAVDLHEFIAGNPRVRVVNRAGRWTTCDTDGTLSTATHAWDWDSLSNPERNDPAAPYWSDEWVIIYAMPWAISGTIGRPATFIGRETGRGHLVTRNEYETIRAIANQAKAAHSRIRSIIWTSDVTKFDPTLGGSLMPDGRWGRWGGAKGECVPRRDGACRYWEL